MKSYRGKKEFLLCRKHIGLDLTETSIFTKSRSKCIYCHREDFKNYYYRKNPQKVKPSINEQMEMTNDRIIPEEPTKLNRKVYRSKYDHLLPEEKKAKYKEKAKLNNREQVDNLKDSYVRKQITDKSYSLKPSDIPQELVETYRVLMQFRRAIKAQKNGDQK